MAVLQHGELTDRMAWRAVRASERGVTGSVGQTVITVQFEKLGWGVAPNPTQHDLGTDLWLQARDERGFDLGALVGAQVKSGDSWFRRPTNVDAGQEEGWWFADNDDKHTTYWAEHRVPHLLILHDQSAEASFWVHVTPDKVISTGKGVKLLVPKANTIDPDHAQELVQIAVGDREGFKWEGSAWNAGVSTPRRDRLRYALLTPRLIAPHPNLTVKELTPESAIALLVKVRLEDLDPRRRNETKAPTLQEARESEVWAWQLYAATNDCIAEGAGTEAIESLISTATEPFERAAAAALACALLVESGKPQEALNVVTLVLDRDDCEPVDHSWLLVHKARCLAELGRIEDAYEHAIRVQTTQSLPSQDPTAMAILGSSADLVFAASRWDTNNMAAAITGRDTRASWWRTQEVSWGLQHHWDAAFKNWAQDARQATGAGNTTWRRLRAASLIAGLSADHNAWRHATGMLAQQVLTTLELGSDLKLAANALEILRLTGDKDSIKLAVKHLIRNGPFVPVAQDANSIDLRRSTRTSVRADLEALRFSADLLTQENANRQSEFILEVLRAPKPFAERLQPTFWITSVFVDTLAELLPAMSHNHVRATVDYITALANQDDQGEAHAYAKLLSRIPSEMWAEADYRALAERHDSDNFELTEAISKVLADGDPAIRNDLLEKVSTGDLSARAAFGDVRDLPTSAVAGLIASLVGKVSEDVEKLRRGQYSWRSVDYGATLLLVNAWHPEQSDWEPIFSLLTVKTAYSQHLSRPLTYLKNLGYRVPETVKDRLVPVLRGLIADPPSPDPFLGGNNIGGDAASALASIRPQELSETELARLLNGTEDRRVAAVRVIAARESPTDLTALAILAKDPSPQVRAQVAFNVAKWVTDGVSVQPALNLLTHVLDDPGTLVAKAVAGIIEDSSPTETVDMLADKLRNHPSASVRRVVAEYLASGKRTVDVRREPDDGDSSNAEDVKLVELTVPQLEAIAKERGLSCYSRLKKSQLLELLSAPERSP
ncbi:hypothetical protein MP11Mi_31440 [Gordonia sp. MP11Mi]|uniref:DUF4365 domain-containing protein n=2 Tax=Gordonia sp. MP11Mi TaxID=3022769 RepID=A0AA97CZ63_9ACTN